MTPPPLAAARPRASVPPPPSSGKPAAQPTPPAGASVPGGVMGQSHDLVTGTIICGRYEVVRFLGRGGMGAVYAVNHVNTGETLALKVLHPALAQNASSVERFRTEARAPVKIGTDNVVRIIDADVSAELGDVPILVMELLTGRDLDTELRRRGALPAGEVVLYLRQVARALDKAHALGIIHRDLKPANLYLTQRDDGTPLVKILDFGIAKLADGISPELTQDGAIFGTPWYMSPEQARGQAAKVGPSIDRWALGLIAFRLLTGRNYWSADGMAALIGQILYEPMVPPTELAPHLGPRFDAWFAQACNREIELRFPSATEQINRLSEALGVSAGMQSSGPYDASQPFGMGSSGQLTPAPVFGKPPSAMSLSPVPISTPPVSSSPYGSASHSAPLMAAPPMAPPPYGVASHSAPLLPAPPMAAPPMAAPPMAAPPLGSPSSPSLGSPSSPSLGSPSPSSPSLSSTPGLPIPPGTFPPSTTGSPVSSSQPSFSPAPPAKMSNALSVAIGILIAVLIAGGATAVWIVISQKPPATATSRPPEPPAAPAPPPVTATPAPPETVAAPVETAAPSAAPGAPEPAPSAAESAALAPTGAPSAAAEAPPEASAAPSSTVAAATVTASAPTSTAVAVASSTGRPLSASGAPSVKPPPKVAPKVGKIQF